MTTPTPLATITGTMLVPGVSKNNRLYTKEAIGRAVTRMRERLSDPDGLPVVMRTHHDAGDNSRLIVGRITDVTQQPDGRATYEAKLYNTTAGRDIGALIDPKVPALRSTSIHGYWIGPVERHRQGDGMVESGSDLEVDAIDFTATPGVPGAQIRSVAFESAAPRVAGRETLDEDGEATVTAEATEAAVPPGPIDEKYNAKQKKQLLAGGQAMPNASGEPSYTIKTKGDLRKAIKAVGRGGADHNKIRAYIIGRAKALGLSAMIPDNWSPDGSLKETVPPGVGETYVVVCVGDDNGPLVKVCAANVDPDLVMKAAKKAAKIAAHALANGPDDDTDGDGFDTTVGPDDGTSPATAYDMDNDNETHSREDGMAETMAETWTVNVSGRDMPADQVTKLVAEALSPPAAPAAEPPKEVAVSDTAQVVEQAAPTQPTPAAVTQPDLAAVIAETVKATVKALRKAEKKDRETTETAATTTDTTETTPNSTTAVAESTTKAGKTELKENQGGITDEQLKKALAAERAATIAEVREQLLREGALPTRRGFRHVNETDDSDKLTGDDLWNKRGEVWANFFPTTHSPAAAEPEPVTAA